MVLVKDRVGPLASRPNRGEYIGAVYTALDTHTDYFWNGANWVVVGRFDPLYKYAAEMKSNGTDVPESAQDAGITRWSLADAATQRVKWTWAIPNGWDGIAVRWGWDNEGAGAGNVNFTFAYRFIFFGEGDVDAGAMTSIVVPPIAAAGQFDFNYALPAETANIATPAGAFGDKPTMVCSLSRDGAADTLNNAIAIQFATATRTA
jgi:hypothetical protein